MSDIEDVLREGNDFLALRHPLFQKDFVMKWADNLYVSDSTKEKKERIIKRANQNAGLRHVFLITLSTNAQDLLDLFDASYLKQPSFYKQELFVVGIASGKEEAIQIAIQIIQDVYQQTGTFSVKDFFVFSGKDSRNLMRRRRGIWGI